MTENEALEMIKRMTIHPNCEMLKAFEFQSIVIKALEDLEQYRAIGTVEEFKALKENQHKCEDCAGCTNWLCDCSNERAKAIDEMVGGIREILECNAIYNIDCITTLSEQLKAGEKNE